jgi:hypothetical protein
MIISMPTAFLLSAVTHDGGLNAGCVPQLLFYFVLAANAGHTADA